MSTITPMSRLKDVIENFKETVGRDIIKRDKILNESKPKRNSNSYWEESWSKGVENEFLRIFETGENESFAFIFNNIKEELDRVLISVSIKQNNDYISRTMSFEEFKTSLKECIRTLKVLKEVDRLDKESLYVSLNNVFKIDAKASVAKTVQKIVNLIEEDTKDIKKELKAARTQKTKTQNKLESIAKETNKELDEYLKTIDFKKEEKAFLEAEAVFMKAKKKFEQTKKLKSDKLKEINSKLEKNETDKAHKTAMDKIAMLEYKLKEIVRKHLKPYDKKLKEAVEAEVL